MWQVPCCKERSSSLRLSHLEAPTPLDRGGISGDFTRLFLHKQGLVCGESDCGVRRIARRPHPTLWQVPRCNKRKFSSLFVSSGSTALLDRGVISGDFTRLFLATFHRQTGTCVRWKRLLIATNRTSTSPRCVASPLL
jgi:hypothetical protein